MQETEQIVFVDETGQPTGETGPKLASHGPNTRRHLAFSCYIFRKADGKFLVTQRALSKKVWPGVWTNSVCGHPAPGESMESAIRRRAVFEAGIHHLQDISVILPNYHYTTPPYNGIIENEFCPVHVAFTDDEPAPNPDEIEAYSWLSWPEYAAMVHDRADQMSYWAKDQFTQLAASQAFQTILKQHGILD
jgi:isopentenyl-diphosphate Delta-isomerase